MTDEMSPGVDDNAEETQDVATDSDLTVKLTALQMQVEQMNKHIAALNEENKSKRLKLKEEREKHATETGQWESVAHERQAEIDRLQGELEDATSYKAQVSEMTDAIRKRNDAKIERIPENKRALVPTSYSPRELADWLDSNMPMLTAPIPPDDDGIGTRGGAGQRRIKLTDEQKHAAKMAGLTEEEYAEYQQNIDDNEGYYVIS